MGKRRHSDVIDDDEADIADGQQQQQKQQKRNGVNQPRQQDQQSLQRRGPVAGKANSSSHSQRKTDDEEAYESRPRLSRAWMDDDESTNRLPIKTKEGRIELPHNKLEKPQREEEEAEGAQENQKSGKHGQRKGHHHGKRSNNDDDDGDDGEGDDDDEDDDEDGADDAVHDDDDALYQADDSGKASSASNLNFIETKKLEIAAAATSVTENPEQNIEHLAVLRKLATEKDPTVVKLALVSQLAVFKDIIPGYRIRDLSEEEKNAKVSKDVKKLRKFESALVSAYQVFLLRLEKLIAGYYFRVKSYSKRMRKATLRSTPGGSQKLPPTDPSGRPLRPPRGEDIVLVANKCICELLISCSHFNFSENLQKAVVSRMTVKNPDGIATMCCGAVGKVFEEDDLGETSLELVRLVQRMVKSKGFNVPRQVLETFLHLRLLEDFQPHQVEEERVEKNKYEKRMEKKLSKKQKQQRKEDKKLELELKESEAVHSEEQKKKFRTEILKVMFAVYFRVLKNAQRSPLLPTVLEGLAKFAHLINVDFFHDLLTTLRELTSEGSEDMPVLSKLHCVSTAFHLFTGQSGELANLDLKHFYDLFYEQLWFLPIAGQEEWRLAIKNLEAMFLRKRQIPADRVAAFLKRTALILPYVQNNAALAILAVFIELFKMHPRLSLLLENDGDGVPGVYQPYVRDPDVCSPFSTNLWELAVMKKHFHPTVSQLSGFVASNKGSISGSPAQILEELGKEIENICKMSQVVKPKFK